MKLSAAPTAKADRVLLTFSIDHGATTLSGPSFEVKAGTAHAVAVTTDPETHEVATSMDGVARLATTLPIEEPIHNDTTVSPSQGEALLAQTTPRPAPSVCQDLIH